MCQSANSAAKSVKAGFTLLEVIVVLAILAIVSALAFVNFGIGSQARALEQAAQRAKLVLEQMCERASFEGGLYGMQVYADGYEVKTPSQPTPPIDGSPWLWQAVKSPGFERTQLADGIEISLEFAGQALNLPIDSSSSTAISIVRPSAPQLVCIDDQSWPQFRLRFTGANVGNTATALQCWVEPSSSLDGALIISKPEPPG